MVYKCRYIDNGRYTSAMDPMGIDIFFVEWSTPAFLGAGEALLCLLRASSCPRGLETKLFYGTGR